MAGPSRSTRALATRTLVGMLGVLVAGMALAAHTRPAWPLFAVAAFGAGVLVAVLWHRDALSTRQVLLGAALFRLLFLPLPPGLSVDGFRYVWDGLVQLQGINPYRYAPEDPALAALQSGPLYEGLNSAEFYSVYPPVSQGVFAFGALFYEWGGWTASYYAIKMVLALFEFGGVVLLARMVQARTLLLYAWHPLVLVEAAGQPHTEAVLVPLLLLTVYCAQRGWGRWAAVALAGAVWTKLYPVVLFPFLWRRFGWRAVWPAVLLSAALLWPYAAPYVFPHMRASLDLYVRFFEFNAGPYYAVKEIFRWTTGADWSKTLGPVFRWLFVACLPLLYALDARRRWALAKAFLATIGAYLVFSTTVHPWYLLAVLPLVAVLPGAGWKWQWLALCSVGTYVFYAGEAYEGAYWALVVLGWGGWLLLALGAHYDATLQRVQRWRARSKMRHLRPLLPEEVSGLRVLDLGAGEGYVGEALTTRLGARVTLADVLPLNRTRLPHIRYDGKNLPFADDAFDVVVLYFVLHHCEDSRQVMREALRVARERVVVAESVYEGEGQRRRLQVLDRWANRLRSGGAMREQEAHLRFRTAAAWKEMARELGADVREEARRGQWVHRQVFFAIDISR